MNRANVLNNYLGDKRKYLLIVLLNVVLVIFVVLEIAIWNDVSDKITEEELAQARREAIDAQPKNLIREIRAFKELLNS